MTLKYHGTFEQLHSLFTASGMQGTWEPEPNGVYMWRCSNGANLHWASGSKTVWFDGPREAVRQLGLQLTTRMLPDDLP